jgi:hypothetical protein
MFMRRRISKSNALLLLCLGIFAAISGKAMEWQQPYPKLGSCTKLDTEIFSFEHNQLYSDCMEDAENAADQDLCSSLYPRTPIPYTEWATRYHSDIDSILESFIGKEAEGNFAQREPPGGQGLCSGSQAASTTPAPPLLGDIAKKLEPWMKNETVFGQSDTTPVLLEYLRVYECSLAERSTSLPIEIWREETRSRELLPGGLLANPLAFNKIFEEWYKQSSKIQLELKVARPTLERVLGFMGTVQMSRVLAQDTNCLQRASLDIRNSLGLSADTAACMPRIWNAKDPMRDPSVCSDGNDNDHDGFTDLDDEECESLSDMTE